MKGTADFGKLPPRGIKALFIPRAFHGSVDEVSARHAATSAVRSACRIKKSAACCALLAAVKIARLSALRTRNHDSQILRVILARSQFKLKPRHGVG